MHSERDGAPPQGSGDVAGTLELEESVALREGLSADVGDSVCVEKVDDVQRELVEVGEMGGVLEGRVALGAKRCGHPIEDVCGRFGLDTSAQPVDTSGWDGERRGHAAERGAMVEDFFGERAQ